MLFKQSLLVASIISVSLALSACVDSSTDEITPNTSTVNNGDNSGNSHNDDNAPSGSESSGSENSGSDSPEPDSPEPDSPEPDSPEPDSPEPDSPEPDYNPTPNNELPDIDLEGFIDVTIVEQENGYGITRSDLLKKEKQLTSSALMKSVKFSISTLDNASVELIEPLRIANPSNVKRVESILSNADFEYIFSKRAPEYTYTKFLKATGKFPAFCGDYTDGRNAEKICRSSLATMFAHFAQETGGHSNWWPEEEWRQALVHVREMGWNEGDRGGYNGECNPDVWQGKTWPCGTFDDDKFKSYFGRGAKQLSYNYNYGPFSQAIYGDVRVLLNNPEKVADTWLNFASAVFFFVYPQPPKPSMLHVIDGTWVPNSRDAENSLTAGFGVTTQIINGGVECGGSTEIAQSLNRIDYYTNFMNFFGLVISDDNVLGCASMKQFDAAGAGALNINWEQDWSWNADNPGEQSFACQLVGYQTAYSALIPGDYAKCVKGFYDISIIEE